MSSTSIPSHPAQVIDHTKPTTQKKESDLAQKFEKFEEDLKETTNQAVADGQEDVTEATATYLEKALHLADTGLAAAQVRVSCGCSFVRKCVLTSCPLSVFRVTSAQGRNAFKRLTKPNNLPQASLLLSQLPLHPLSAPQEAISD